MSDFTLNQRWAATLVGALVKGGVAHAVIAPGSRSTPLALAFADRADVKSWSVIDERSAAFFALGIAKATRVPVAVVCTSGTAGAHFLPAIMEARESGVPVVALTADRPWELHGFGAPQTIEQTALFGAYVERCEPLPTPDEATLGHLAQVVGKALSLSRHGPVHFNVPFREPLAPTTGGRGPVIDPPVTRAVPSEARVNDHELSSFVATVERGLIVCGPQDPSPEWGQRVHRLGERLGFPVIAEAASNARFGFPTSVSHADALLRTERFASAMRPQFVLRIGGGLTPKGPQAWLDASGAAIAQVHLHGARVDPSHSARWALDALPELPEVSAALRGPRESYRRAWLDADAAVERALEGQLATLDEPGTARALVQALPEGARLFVSSSMPIRDVDAFATSPRGLQVFANRGVNGIDGVVSSALGVSAALGGKTALLIGDVAALHDLSGWLIARRHALDLVVVVVNNDGGGIFHFLPIAGRSEHFEALFGTPHGVDLSRVADLSGARYCRPATLSDFSGAVREGLGGGLHLIEVKTNRSENVDRHRTLFESLSRALS